MRIAVNALGSISKDTGGKNYLINFVKYIQEIDNNNEYFLFLSNESENIFNIYKPSVNIIYLKKSNLNAYSKVFFEQLILPFYLIKYRIDAVYFPGNYACIFSTKPILLFIQSVLDFYKSEDISFLKKIYRHIFLRLSARKAKKIITPSSFAKEIIIKNLKIPKLKIDVVYHGIDNNLFNNKIDDEILDKGKKLLSKNGINGKYILYVAALWDHKNHEKLILAFERLLKLKNIELKLVLVGSGLGTNKVFLKYIYNLPKRLGLSDNVIFIDNLDLKDLSIFYKLAHMFVFPSLCESFGLPVIEAMACGLSIICSDAFALPEILSDAGILVNAKNTDEILNAMLLIIENETKRKELIEKAVKRAEIFKWEISILKTIKTLESLADK